MLRYFLILLFVISVGSTWAQSSSKKKKKKKSESAVNEAQPSSLQPYYPAKNYEPPKRKPSGKITYDARDKFYDRMEAIAKQERKNEKAMEKPENSDPMYFGHKRPPKKRPPGKMKFCKVCGIRH
jgi:hypothetical protein